MGMEWGRDRRRQGRWTGVDACDAHDTGGWGESNSVPDAGGYVACTGRDARPTNGHIHGSTEPRRVHRAGQLADHHAGTCAKARNLGAKKENLGKEDSPREEEMT